MPDLACVVILNWNGKDFVRDCLKSVLHQNYPRYRVLVVDNGSTDGSGEMIKGEFPEVKLVPLPENLHFARGTNAGIREALKDSECTHIVTLNNDTRVDPEWLEELVHVGSDVGMVASKLLLMDQPKTINSTGLTIAPDGSALDRGWNQVDEGQYDRSEDVFGPTAGAALYRRELIDQIGLFDEEFVAYYEDVDLAWRARLAGWQARYAPRAVVYHKFSASHRRGSSLKTYLCERNRIWNLVQNYPWRYVALTVPWNSARILAGPIPWNGGSEPVSRRIQNPALETARAMARARLDAYAGIPRALAKRRARATASRVTPATVGDWLRRYHVSFRDAVLA
jgi:GT2 family glycosyltransferase